MTSDNTYFTDAERALGVMNRIKHDRRSHLSVEFSQDIHRI